jgi:hypothetical protein
MISLGVDPALKSLMVGKPEMLKGRSVGRSFSVASSLAMTILSLAAKASPTCS